MGVEGIDHPIYNVFSARVGPIFSLTAGTVILIISIISEELSVFVTMAAAYTMYESIDDFVDELCDEELDRSIDKKVESSVTKLQLLQGISVFFCLTLLFIILGLTLNGHGSVIDLTIEGVLFAIPALIKLSENIMEIWFIKKSIKTKKRLFIFKDDHLTSVVRDGYRLFLKGDHPSGTEREAVIGQIEDMQENYSDHTLKILNIEDRVQNIVDILLTSKNPEAGTGTDVYSSFGMYDVVKLNRQEPPPELKRILATECPFHPSAKVRDTHTFFFLPAKIIGDDPFSMSLRGQQTSNIGKDCRTSIFLSAEVMGEKAKNFIPGVGVNWRYEPVLEKKRTADYWVLMYIGPPRDPLVATTTTTGIVPETFNTSWEESMQILQNLNEKMGNSETNGYNVMTNAEVVAGAFSHFVQTGDRIFRETFTRVEEETETLEHSVVCGGRKTSHLFIGRLNLSGLNNDAYLDVGGDLSRHPLRGLSVCRRFKEVSNQVIVSIPEPVT